MNIADNSYLNKILILLLVNSGLYLQPVSATEWKEDFVSKSSFSDFSPPSVDPDFRNSVGEKQWGSGRSFNEDNKVRYSPVTTKNPWKAVKSTYSKKTFSGQRPWGNIPDRKPSNKNNMKLHDQRFKQWSHQNDSSYRNNFVSADPFTAYGRSLLPLGGAYGYPGTMHHNPLITPSIYPGLISNGLGYGGYPGGSYPYTGLLSRPRFW
ncbi:MAG: hypothetical protein OEY66_01265 [Gammaproteobacteria bacterium]|nr:hypothetical protein [Gammaproteobacteria bacterium]